MPQPQKGVERPDEAAAPGISGEASSELAELSFEASLERLEGVVDQLERGDLELEASLVAFEEGVRLSARCSQQLVDAEQRIETLTQEGGSGGSGGSWVSRPFDTAEVDELDVEDEGEEAS